MVICLSSLIMMSFLLLLVCMLDAPSSMCKLMCIYFRYSSLSWASLTLKCLIFCKHNFISKHCITWYYMPWYVPIKCFSYCMCSDYLLITKVVYLAFWVHPGYTACLSRTLSIFFFMFLCNLSLFWCWRYTCWSRDVGLLFSWWRKECAPLC